MYAIVRVDDYSQRINIAKNRGPVEDLNISSVMSKKSNLGHVAFVSILSTFHVFVGSVIFTYIAVLYIH